MGSSSGDAVGFIGLGNIGLPMARRLLEHPGGLVVHDLDPAAVARLERRGAVAAGSPADVARRSGVVCVVVRDEAQVRAVLTGGDDPATGLLAGAAPGTVVCVHSTIGPDAAEDFARLGAGHGVDVLDAPVSGGAMGAGDGTLAVMVGGPDAAVERARPVLERLATLVLHMGPAGAGTRTKVARNLISFASFAVAGEAARLADAAGLDVAKLGDVVRHSDRVTGGPGAVMLRGDAGVLADDDGLRAVFEHTAALGAKDLGLAVELGDELDVPTPFAELAAATLRAALGLDPAAPRD